MNYHIPAFLLMFFFLAPGSIQSCAAPDSQFDAQSHMQKITEHWLISTRKLKPHKQLEEAIRSNHPIVIQQILRDGAPVDFIYLQYNKSLTHKFGHSYKCKIIHHMIINYLRITQPFGNSVFGPISKRGIAQDLPLEIAFRIARFVNENIDFIEKQIEAAPKPSPSNSSQDDTDSRFEPYLF